MARHVADCVLLDGVITGGPTEVTPAPLKGLRFGLPRGYFWEDLDAELAAILEAALARLREAGVVLVEGDVANVAALDAAAGFPIMLYETVIELERYLAEHETGLRSDCARPVSCWSRATLPMSPRSTPPPAFRSCSTRR